MSIIKKNQAKKLFSILGLFLALFLFITPVFAGFDCQYTTSTGAIVCDTDDTITNIQTFLDWIIVFCSFFLVISLIRIILSIV